MSVERSTAARCSLQPEMIITSRMSKFSVEYRRIAYIIIRCCFAEQQMMLSSISSTRAVHSLLKISSLTTMRAIQTNIMASCCTSLFLSDRLVIYRLPTASLTFVYRSVLAKYLSPSLPRIISFDCDSHLLRRLPLISLVPTAVNGEIRALHIK